MEPKFSQVLAAVLVAFGCCCVGAADHYNWRDLANVGNTVVGVGAGILTGPKLPGSNDGTSSLKLLAPSQNS